jgi:hypothetical protein
VCSSDLTGFAATDFNYIFNGMGICMIPLFVGLGYLLIHFFEKKEKKEKNDGDK